MTRFLVSFTLVGLLAGSQICADETPLPAGARARLGSLRLRHDTWIEAICFAPDGKTIATASGNIRVWNAADGKLLLEIANSEVFTLAFAPDGRTIAGGVGPDVCFWDLQSGREVRRLAAKGGRINALAFASDGKRLVCSDTHNFLYQWNLQTSKCSHCRNYFDDNPRRVFANGHADKQVHLAAVAADGNTAVWFVRDWRECPNGAVSGAGHLVVWDWPSGKVRCKIDNDNPNDPFHVALSPDGKLMTYASNGWKAVTLWETATGKSAKTLDEGSRVNTIAFSPDGRRVAAVLDGHGLVVWDIATGMACLREPFHAWYSRFGSLTFSPDGRKLAVAQENAMRIWDVRSGKETPLLDGHRQAVVSLAVSAADETLISGDDQHRCTWDRHRQTQRKSVLASAHEGSLAVSYPLNLRVIQPNGGRLQLRTLDSGTLVGEFPYVDEIYSLGSFSGDGRTLAFVGRMRSELTIFDVPSRRIRSTIPLGKGDDPPFVLTHDGRSVAIGCFNETAKLIDTFTGKVTRTLGDSRDTMPDTLCWSRLSLGVFSADGQWLAFATDPSCAFFGGLVNGPEKNPRIRVWHVPSGRELYQFEKCLSQATGTTVTALSFSPDNRCLVVALKNDDFNQRKMKVPAARVLELASGQQRHLLDGHVVGVCSVAFLADGKTLATGGADGTILLWDLERTPGRPTTNKGTADRLDRHWRELTNVDAMCAHDAAMAFTARPDEAVPFLAERLKLIERPSDEQLAKWLVELDNDVFHVREAATEKLGMLGPYARPALTRTLQSKPSAEVRRRTQELLDRLDTPEISPALLRELRSIEILERIASAEANKVLKRLAAGVPGRTVTVEANAALVRLAANGKR